MSKGQMKAPDNAGKNKFGLMLTRPMNLPVRCMKLEKLLTLHVCHCRSTKADPEFSTALPSPSDFSLAYSICNPRYKHYSHYSL